MDGLHIDPKDHKTICEEYNRIGGFLTTIARLENEIIPSIKAEDLIARSLAEKHVITEEERDRVVSNRDASIPKGRILLDVLLTKESRDAMALQQLLRETKQFQLASRIDEEMKQVERIVNSKIDGDAPTQYFLPALSMADESSSDQPDIIGTDDGMIKIYRRNAWGAKPKKDGSPLLREKLPYVILSHTTQVGNHNTTEDCLKAVNQVQQYNMSRGFGDIAFNYLVGNDGSIYEGRGHVYEGATARGKYVDAMPSEAALEALKIFLKYLKKEDVLAYDFTIHCLRQVREEYPVAPGDPLFQKIKTWRANDPDGWAWREKDDEEAAYKPEGDPLSEKSREILREKQPYLVDVITDTLKLLDVLCGKMVFHRSVKKSMKKECLQKEENCDEELKKVILDHFINKGTYVDIQKLIEALVELHQIAVANRMYKYFPTEERKKLTITQRRNRDIPRYEEIPFEKIHFSKKHGKEKNPVHLRLGAGRYGKVEQATIEGKGNEPVAVKKLKDLTERNIHEFKREAEMQFQLRHSSIATVYGMVCNETYDYYWIVMEYMAHGSLKDLLHKLVVPWPVKVRMMRDIARGMQFMHKSQGDWRKSTITHGDLKAANVLVDENYAVKISDFGSSVQNYVTSSVGVDHQFDKWGTVTHFAPELVRESGSRYNPDVKSDIWSFGILDFEVCAENTHGTDELRVPFYNKIPSSKIRLDIGKDDWHPLKSNNSEQMKKIPMDECPKVLLNVIFHCCENDPDKRPKDFAAITDTLDAEYEKDYKKMYPRCLASLILQHEELMMKDSTNEEPMEQAVMVYDVMEQMESFELEDVAPLYDCQYN